MFKVLRLATADIVMILDSVIPKEISNSMFQVEETRQTIVIRVPGDTLPDTSVIDYRKGQGGCGIAPDELNKQLKQLG